MVLTLRMFTEAELDHFEAQSAVETSYNWFGFRGTAGIRRDFAVDGLVGADTGTLAVDLDGTVIGDVGWIPRPYGPPPVPPALSIGVQLRSPYRGQGYGTEAQRQLAAYLFSVHAVHRIEASTDVTNVAEQRALTKAGFRREGVLRGAQFRDGRYRDLVQFGRLRDDDPERGDDRDPEGHH